MSQGKGSRIRPSSVDAAIVERNWQRTFGDDGPTCPLWYDQYGMARTIMPERAEANADAPTTNEEKADG